MFFLISNQTCLDHLSLRQVNAESNRLFKPFTRFLKIDLIEKQSNLNVSNSQPKLKETGIKWENRFNHTTFKGISTRFKDQSSMYVEYGAPE